jgi:hypothetical protein
VERAPLGPQAIRSFPHFTRRSSVGERQGVPRRGAYSPRQRLRDGEAEKIVAHSRQFPTLTPHFGLDPVIGEE